jgi:uncharacterized protein
MRKKKSTQGFASLTPERRREIARKGGAAAWKNGKAHKFTPDEAVKAIRKRFPIDSLSSKLEVS